MVDPARFIAADRGINHFPTFKPENESMRIGFFILSLLPGNPLACIFDDAGASRDKSLRVNTPAMHA